MQGGMKAAARRLGTGAGIGAGVNLVDQTLRIADGKHEFSPQELALSAAVGLLGTPVLYAAPGLAGSLATVLGLASAYEAVGEGELLTGAFRATISLFGPALAQKLIRPTTISKAPRIGDPNASRPTIQNRLPSRVTSELPEGQIRTPAELEQARNFYKRNIAEAREWYTQRTGEQWPVDPATGKFQWAEHPRALKNGGDPLRIEPGIGPDPNAPHQVIGPDGLTDSQRFGRMLHFPSTSKYYATKIVA
jgi:hypothetical protein